MTALRADTSLSEGGEEGRIPTPVTAGHTGLALQGTAVIQGGQSRPPLQSRTRTARNGRSYPKGICSAALHGRTPSPTGGSTHLPHRAARPQAAVYPRRRFPVMQCAHLPFRRQQASSHPLTCHGMVPQASRTHFSGITKPRDFRRGVPCWRYLSSQAVSSQVLSAEASLTSVFGMGTGGPSP